MNLSRGQAGIRGPGTETGQARESNLSRQIQGRGRRQKSRGRNRIVSGKQKPVECPTWARKGRGIQEAKRGQNHGQAEEAMLTHTKGLSKSGEAWCRAWLWTWFLIDMVDCLPVICQQSKKEFLVIDLLALMKLMVPGDVNGVSGQRKDNIAEVKPMSR